MFLQGVFVKRKNKRLILYRMTGEITYPDSFFGKPLHGKFDDIKAIISITGHVDGVSHKEYLKFVNTFRPRLLDTLKTMSYGDPYEYWSFMVWYMDKNRPLPPCRSFDPYREKDFLRRQAEGFPPPLYPSNVPTPEATAKHRKIYAAHIKKMNAEA